MRWRNWTVLLAVLAVAAAGCTSFAPKVPPHDSSRLGNVSQIDIAVQINVYEYPGSLMPEWSTEARGRMIATLASTFSANGFVVTLNDVLPEVPWSLQLHGVVQPRQFETVECKLIGHAPITAARLEVVGIQIVKSAGARLQDSATGLVGLVFPPAWIMWLYPPLWGAVFGPGETAIRFCLFEPGTAEPVWAYVEWFHAGLDLRDSENVEELIKRVQEHYRAALAKKDH